MNATVTGVPPSAAPGGTRRRPARQSLVGFVLLVAALAMLWRGVTVVPDRELGHTDLAGNPTFDARSFVDSIWESRVVPLMRDHAADAGTVLDALAADPDKAGATYGHRSAAGDGPWTFIVSGKGQIKIAYTKPRHATLLLTVGGHDLIVQIGPVIFGTTLRDGLPFVSFAEVVNQIQFAQVSRELNDRATASIRAGGLDVAKLAPGDTVSFAGAMSAGQPPMVTAVRLDMVP